MRILPGVVSAALAVSAAVGMLRFWGSPSGITVAARNPGQLCRMYLSNQLADALAGVLAQEKVYWIASEELAAPLPEKDAYYEADPAELADLPEQAERILKGQSLFFSPEVKLLPGEKVRVYQDETILALTWKEPLDGGVYTFSEVKIAHPSQFRRFLAGGKFGSEELFVTTEMAQSVNAVVASSGDFYNYRRAGTIVYDGLVRRVDNGLVDTCYIDRNGDLHFSRREGRWDAAQAQQFVDEQNIQFSLAFGPVLIESGEVVTPDSYAVGEIHDYYPRAALCQLGQLHYLLAVVNAEGEQQETPDIRRFAQNLQKRGVQTAYALDGGQTAVIAMDGKCINAVLYGHQRKISDIIYFATAIPGRQEDTTDGRNDADEG